MSHPTIPLSNSHSQNQSFNQHVFKSTGQKYHQDTEWIPAFYNRPGPGMYDVNDNLKYLSSREGQRGVKIHKSHMLKGVLGKVGPKHRFTDFSKSQLAIQLHDNLPDIEDRKYLESLSKLHLSSGKRIDFMNPSIAATIKN